VVCISPDTSVIESYRQSGLSWHERFGEFIDNSFDAKATQVRIRVTSDSITIMDDGIGCPDPLVMVRLGGRSQHSGKTLGRYGIGVKDAAISTANVLEIDTTHGGVWKQLKVDWLGIQRSNSWDIPEPTVTAVDKLASGTKIRLSSLVGKIPSKPDRQAIVDRLSMIYTPAIKQGRSIVFTWPGESASTPVPEFVWPVLERERSAELAIGGKSARVRLGLVPEGSQFRQTGLVLAHHYRVIQYGKKQGLSVSGRTLPRLFGWVDLIDTKWKLSKNKTSLDADQYDELAEAIRGEFRTEIEAAETAVESRVFQLAGDTINDAIRELLGSIKAKRASPTNKTGAVVATGRGGQHQRAVNTQPGNRFRASGFSQTKVYNLRYAELPDNLAYEIDDDGTVTVNESIPFLRSIRDNYNALTLYLAQIVSADMAKREFADTVLSTLEYSERIPEICSRLLRGAQLQTPENLANQS
jgi:hypothetical protein